MLTITHISPLLIAPVCVVCNVQVFIQPEQLPVHLV